MTERKQINTATILEHWRGRPEWELVNKLAVLDTGIRPEEMQKAFLDIFDYLRKDNSEIQIQELIQKAKTIGLSPPERASLQELIAGNKK